jgi:sulfotransferase family protein
MSLPADSFCLPTFIGVGPPRTGTTWLHEALAGHANLPRYNKETRFFCTNYAKGVAWYVRHFDSSSELTRGEVCPTYFCSTPARERIAELIPKAKIICSFREPVGRIYSLYKLKRAFARMNWSFEEALIHDPELLESGRYAHYLVKWQRAFGQNNVLPVLYDDLARDPQGYIDRIVDFVGMPRFQLDERWLSRVHSSDAMSNPRSRRLTALAADTAEWLKRHHLERVVAAVKGSKLGEMLLGGGEKIPPLSRTTADTLRASLCPEIDALEKLLNRDLSSWKGIVHSGELPATVQDSHHE